MSTYSGQAYKTLCFVVYVNIRNTPRYLSFVRNIYGMRGLSLNDKLLVYIYLFY